MSTTGTPTGPSWRRFLKLSLLGAVFTLSSAYLIVIDPLSIDTTADKIASDFFNVVFSPLYPGGASGHDGRSEIVVLVYDDAYLRAANTGWGFSPNEYKPLFTRIAEAGARAVFFDIQFLRGDGSRDASIASLYKHASALEEEHLTKFVFAGVLADPMPQFAGVAANRYALAEMHASEDAYALYQQMPGDPHYALPTAAFSLYKIWCEAKCEAEGSSVALGSKLFIEWGFAPDPEMWDHSAGSNGAIPCQIERGALIDVPQQVWRRLVLGWDGSQAAPCMYHRNFSVYFINSLRDASELSGLLQGKIVLVGTNVTAHSDYTQSPVHGTVPGVFRHAMALDNLMERGSGYVRWVDDPASAIFELAILAVMLAGLLWFSNVAVPAEYQSLDADRLRVLFGVAAGLFLWVVVLGTIAFARWGANNWISYALMFGLVTDVSVPALCRLAWARPAGRWWNRVGACLVQCLILSAALCFVAMVVIGTIVAAYSSAVAYALESVLLTATLLAVVVYVLRRVAWVAASSGLRLDVKRPEPATEA